MPETKFDLVVIGAGPGGYHAAIRGAQLGFKTAVVEKDDGTGIGGLGGVCLNWGCIPSKSLLKNAELVNTLKQPSDWGLSFDNFRADMGKAVERSRKVSTALTQGIGFLLKKNKIEVFKGKGSIAGPTSVQVEGGPTLEAKHIVIATGARPRSLPNLEIDLKSIITSRQALELKETPKSIGIVGGSAIGVEFAYYFRAYGAEVTIFEMLPHLVPAEDEEVSVELERAFKKQGINFVTGAKVSGTEKRGAQLAIKYEAGGQPGEFVCDKVMLGVGVQPNSDGIGLEKVGVQVERGFIKVNDRLQTTIPNIYAVGDVTGKMMLAHVAFTQGVTVAESLKGLNPPAISYPDMPRCTYCVPQIASIGLTEKQAREKGFKVKIGKFPFRGAGKAVAIGDHEGFVKIVSNEESGEVLGAHMIGPEVTEMIAEFGVLKTLEGTPYELGVTTHAHPTLSEAVKEAALAVHGEAIHF
ncbi:MAG: dihydrolipoyl dehydrogenase [SAR202 cluster bacterium]|nr:dihydrolipoyl dehydrogenase [SAR202 cluster bacterium]